MSGLRRRPALIRVQHGAVLLLVLLWLAPTLGLFVSSLRTADQMAGSGWWKALFPSAQSLRLRAAPPRDQHREGALFVLEGDLFAPGEGGALLRWGIAARAHDAFAPGETAALKGGGTITVTADGQYRMVRTEAFSGPRGQRIFVTLRVPPQFTLNNYRHVLFSGEGGMLKAFYTTLAVALPATLLPLLLAAFAAYALAWMVFPGRALLLAAIVGLLVMPLQLALIPLLRLHLELGIGKGYVGVWLAHTGFGLPLAIYLLRNYMAGLPRDIIENARLDGATEWQIFTRIVLPLSFPALAAFAIFQFLWTWNDLLVARVFLMDASGETTVMTAQLRELSGTFGGNWELLAAAGFVSMLVPLLVFFTLQRYLVRGLLAGSDR
ncbi:MAG: alpha-glucoside ABC transporter permease [Rhodobacterales bacterium]|nr:MAG: alpha-glucoside ABC transporter permease [Rhodobacterales bacterium]PIE09229.1 MAG: alpha-glucoside ABC transporter permease [Rhodobacterales bacterium]